MLNEEQVRLVKRRHSERLRQIPGVHGVGIEKDDKGEFVLSVHVDAETSGTGPELPSRIEGVPVKLIRSGPFQKQ